MERRIETFDAESDSGKLHRVELYQEFMEIRQVGHPISHIPGLKRLALRDGTPVNQIDPQTFKIVTTEEIIRRL